MCGRERHACSQEAIGNLSTHRVALQAQIFETCLCHSAIGAGLPRLLSSICTFPNP